MKIKPIGKKRYNRDNLERETMQFEPYPFEKLNTLLAEITPNPELEPILLTIGEPQFETPAFIQKALQESAPLLKKYPKTELKRAK